MLVQAQVLQGGLVLVQKEWVVVEKENLRGQDHNNLGLILPPFLYLKNVRVQMELP
jgi:hypothetical protein